MAVSHLSNFGARSVLQNYSGRVAVVCLSLGRKAYSAAFRHSWVFYPNSPPALNMRRSARSTGCNASLEAVSAGYCADQYPAVRRTGCPGNFCQSPETSIRPSSSRSGKKVSAGAIAGGSLGRSKHYEFASSLRLNECRIAGALEQVHAFLDGLRQYLIPTAVDWVGKHEPARSPQVGSRFHVLATCS